MTTASLWPQGTRPASAIRCMGELRRAADMGMAAPWTSKMAMAACCFAPGTSDDLGPLLGLVGDQQLAELKNSEMLRSAWRRGILRLATSLVTNGTPMVFSAR